MNRMFQHAVFFVSLIILEGACSLPVEEKIEPVDLYHHCIEPEKDKNEPDKSPVILIHGLLGTYRDYDGIDQVIAKRTKRKVCAVDLRNHGDSPWNNRTDIASLAVDIGHYLDKHNIKSANFIGESLGGKVAIHYTLTNPERVDSLIVEDMRPNNLRKTALRVFQLLIKYIKTFLHSQPKGMTESEAKQWANSYARQGLQQMENNNNVPEDLTKYMDFILVDGYWQPKHNLELIYKTFQNNPLQQWAESTGLYKGPVMFVYGTESMMRVGDDAENILKLFPNAKLVPMEGVGHIIHEIHPEFDDIAVVFLNQIK